MRSFHAFRLELEDRRGLGGLQECIGFGIVERQAHDIDEFIADACSLLVDRPHGPVDDGERFEPEKVELDEARLLDVVEIELGHHAATALVGVQRYVVRQRRRRDDHAAGVLAGIANDAFELVGHLHDFRGVLVALDELAQLRLLVDGLLQGHADLERDHLREPVGQAERLVLGARHVAHDEAGRHRAEGDDLADRVVAVAFGDVGDHPFPAFHAEVDVEVGHGHALGVQQAFEDEAVVERIQIRDAEAECHQRGRAGAAAAHRDIVLPSPDDELLHDQEVAGKAHLDDDPEFVVEPRTVGIGVAFSVLLRTRGEELLESAGGLFAQRRLERGALRYRVLGQVVGAEFDLAVAALGNLDGVVDGFGKIGEEIPHLRGRAQVLLVAVPAFSPRVVENAAFLDAHAGFVGLEVVGGQEPDIVARDDRHARANGEVHRLQDELLFAPPTRAHDLEVDAVGERVAPGRKPPCGDIRRAARHPDIARGAEQHDQALGRIQDRLAGDASVAVSIPVSARRCIRVGRRHQSQEVGVARRVGHQDDAAAQRPVRLLVIQVGTDQRLDPGIAAGGVELHEPEEVRAVGERHGGHVQLAGPGREVLDLDQAVGDRELAVQREVDEVREPRARVVLRPDRLDLVARLVGNALRRHRRIHEACVHSVVCRGASTSPAASATGANVRRCRGVGPKRRRLSRCAAVA